LLHEKTDDQFYNVINDHPGSNAYHLAKRTGWSPSKLHASVPRLERDGMIQTRQVVKNSRVKIIVDP